MSVKAVFDHALEIHSTEDRKEYLDSACAGAPELRAEVESLLRAHADAGSFLERPVSAPTPAADETIGLESAQPTRSVIPAIAAAGNDATSDGSCPPTVPPDDSGRVPGYVIVSELGRGGMGVVYKATHTALNRMVALKMLPGDRGDEKTLIRFLAEAEAIAAVEHPNVVQVYDYGESDGRPFMALEFVPGGTLTEELKRVGRFPPDTAAGLVEKIARGVQAAHGSGIVHRDLKPGNVLMAGSGEPKVTDFGLAKRSGGADLTRTQAVMGTPAYMAPEQARGDTKFVTPAADVHALGVILYECLTGTRPFDATDATDTLVLLRRVAEDDPEPPRKRAPGTPRDLELICLKCLAKHPGERYATAGALADDLTRFVNREPVSVRAAGWVERGYRWARRRPTAAAVYALTALAVVLGSSAGLALTLWQRAEVARASAEDAKVEAEGARDQSKHDKARAEEALSREQAAQEQLARFDYNRTIDLAHRQILGKNGARARELLALCRPDLRRWEWGYVDRLAHRELAHFEHPRIPISVSLSPDGTRVAVSTFDQTAPVWDLRTGKLLFELRSGKSIGTVEFSPDGARIAAVSATGTAVCDGHTGRELFMLKSTDDVVRFCTDGKRIVTVGRSKEVKTWDAATGEARGTLKLADDTFLTAAVSPDGTRIATAGYGGTRIWDATDGRRLQEFGKNANRVDAVAFSPDGGRVVDGRDNGAATVWDVRTGTELTRLREHEGDVTTVAFSPDGKCVLTGGRDRVVILWDAHFGRPLKTLRGRAAQLSAVGFGAGGRRLVTASWDKTVKVWDTAPDNVRIYGQYNFLHPTISSDGKRVAVSDNRFGKPPTAHVWDAHSGEEIRTVTGPAKAITVVALGPDGSRLVTGSEDGTAKVWNLATGATAFDLVGHGKKVTAVAFSPDGKRIVTLGLDFVGRVWDAESGKLIHADLKLTTITEAIAMTTDGGTIVTGGYDRTVRVWDGNTGRLVLTIPGVAKVVSSVALSPDGRRIVTGCLEPLEDTAHVWDTATGRKVASLRGHAGGIYSIAFSRDGSRVATGGSDQTVRVWDTESGQELLTTKHSDGQVTALQFSTEGAKLIAACVSGAVHTYDASPPPPVVPPELAPRLGK